MDALSPTRLDALSPTRIAEKKMPDDGLLRSEAGLQVGQCWPRRATPKGSWAPPRSEKAAKQ
eukprot:2910237-Prymnesium_polylepis.2